MKIVAKDETGIAYITYQWEDGEPVTVNADQQGQTEMIVQVPLTVGLKKIQIIAVDTNGNIEEIEKEIEKEVQDEIEESEEENPKNKNSQ